jgi:hypothetical protein
MYKIPVSDMPVGIDLCKKNVEHFLDDARTLSKKGTTQSSGHPIASIVFAIEELGKAKILGDCLQVAEKKGVADADVKESLFRGYRAHDWKFLEGSSLLPQDILILKKGRFDPKHFDPRVFDTTGPVILVHTMRLDATFVDWCQAERKWKIGAPVDPEKIERIASEIERALKTLR